MFLGVSLSMGVGACSQGLGGSSSAVNNNPVNSDCNIPVSSKSLDAPSLRGLVHCFNAYGALEPVDQLLGRMSDSDVQNVANVISQYFLSQPTVLYELDQTFQELQATGKLDGILSNFGALLQNDQFLVTTLTLLKDGYYQQPGTLAGLFSSPQPDSRMLASMAFLSSKLNSPNVATGLDAALTLVSAPAFQSIQEKLQPASPTGTRLKDLTDATLEYVQSRESDYVPVGQMALNGFIREDLFQALDDSIGGATPDSIGQGTDRMSSVIRELTGGGGQVFDGITSLFKALHHPMECLKGTQVVADGDMFILSQIATQNSADVSNFLLTTQPLTMITINPLCNYPPELATYFPSVQQLARSSAIEPAADLVKAFYRSQITDPAAGAEHPLADMLIGMLGESAIKKMIPVLGELTSRDAWDDLILLATLPAPAHRDGISSALQVLNAPVPGLGGASASTYDLFVEALQRVLPTDFFHWVSSVDTFVGSNATVFQPAILSARDFYYANNVHPVVDLAQKFLADAPKNTAFFNSLFKTVGMAEFQDSVKLLSAMAKDGRLKQLINTILTIYRPISQGGQVNIQPTTEPAFASMGRDSFSDLDLKPYPVLTTPPNPGDPCANLDLSFGPDQFGDPNYSQKLNSTVTCLAQVNQDPNILADVQYLQSVTSSVHGWNFFQFPIEIIEGFNPSKQELQYLSDAWLRSYDSGYFLNLLETIPFFVDQTISPADGGAAFAPGPVLRPLFDLASPLVSGESQAQLDKIENFVANQLRAPTFPQTLKVAHDLYTQVLEPTETPVVTDFDQARIERWVKNKECERPESANPELRATQIIGAFDTAVDNWSVENGDPKTSYTFDEFKSLLGPTVEKLADPSLDAPDESLQQALLNIVRYFTLEPNQQPNQLQHYTPDDLIKWIKDRSEDYRLITLYYKDENGNFEDQPRVKLVNSLDLMELVVVEADFQVDILGMQIAGNSALQYLGELAEAWGDEPRSLWPDRIQALYPPGRPIRKIQDVVNDMYKSQTSYADLTGYPSPPDCQQEVDPHDPSDVQKAETSWPRNSTGIHLPEIGVLKNVERSLFNLNQVLEVLEENVPGSTVNPAHAGGLTVLRDIMYELYFSTPQQSRGYKLKPENEESNNLKVAADLSRLGTFRILAQKLRQFSGNEPALRDLFRTMTFGAQHPETNDAFTALFVKDPGQQVFWNTAKSVFAVLDSAEGNYTPEQQSQLAAMTDDQAAAQKNEWVLEADRMKQFGEYALALGESQNLTAPLMSTIALGVNEFPNYLAGSSSGMESLLRSQGASYFMRALYEEPDAPAQQSVVKVISSALSDPAIVRAALNLLQAIDNDPDAQNSWSLFSDRDDTLQGLPAFQPYRQYFDRFGNDLVFFFTDQSTDPSGVLAADHMRLYLADLLQQGDIDQFLILAKNDPNKFYQVLQTLSHYVENGELQNFLNLVRGSLSAPSQ